MTSTQRRVLKLQVLPLPFKETAQALLESVVRDVHRMMCRHMMVCGALTEFYPSPDRPLLRGLNREMGHIIFIRLRKHGVCDEFLEYSVILNTVVHELSHNVITEHSQRFWQLYLVLRREVACDMGEDLKEVEGERQGYSVEELHAEEAAHGGSDGSGGALVPRPTYECIVMPPPPPPLFVTKAAPQQRRKCAIC